MRMGCYHETSVKNGYQAFTLLKKITMLLNKINSLKNRRLFLLRGRDEGVLPKFIVNGVKFDHNNPDDFVFFRKVQFEHLSFCLKQCTGRMEKFNLAYNLMLVFFLV